MDILTENKKSAFWDDFVVGAIAGVIALLFIQKVFKPQKENIVEALIATGNELIKKKEVDASDVLKAANVVAKRQALGGEFHFDNNEIVFLKPHR